MALRPSWTAARAGSVFCDEAPYHIENGINFYQRFEVKALLDCMRLISNPNSLCIRDVVTKFFL